MSCLLSPSLVSNHSRKESRRLRIQDRSGQCLSPSRHWEVELWRRNQTIAPGHSESSISDLSRCHNTLPPSPALPPSPTAFNLDAPLPSPGPHGGLSILTPRHTDHRPEPACPHDLDQLRLDALTELQRSVIETGEGFVDKMRDWETRRQREAAGHRGLKRSRSMMVRRISDPMDDSDDVMILDPAPADEEVHRWESPRKRRALSVDIVDVLDATPTEEAPSATTDDDTESWSRDSMSAVPSSDAPPYSNIPSSYPDKAVSALTLAFANGACGINDYQAVLDAYSHTHSGEESHVGELWD